MSNDVQHMPYQILDLGLKCYLRTSDLHFILCTKIWWEWLMKILILSFHKRKKNGFLIKIQIWLGFLNVGKNIFFLWKHQFYERKTDLVFLLRKKGQIFIWKKCKSDFFIKNRKDFYLEKYRSDFINKI